MTTADLSISLRRNASRLGMGRASARTTAVVMVVAGMFTQTFGAAVASLLFPRVGALGAVTLRLGIGAIVMLLLVRPAVRGYGRRDWAVVLAFGVALCAMNSVFYEAIERAPLGAVVTLELLGPLTLSVVTARRGLSWLWAALALAGVALLGQGGFSGLTLSGAILALIAGGTWAAYIVLSAQTGQRFPGTDGLALSLVAAAALSLPLGIVDGGAALLSPVALGAGALVAAGSTALPYSLEMCALRRLPAQTFAVLMSLMPAVATVAGLVMLHQGVDPTGLLAIVLVIAASAGAIWTAPSAPAPEADAAGLTPAAA